MPANPAVADYIRQAAIARGIDPGYALKVASSEALNVFDPSKPDLGGDERSSFGPFQLHYAGMSKNMPHAGLGDAFTQKTGLHASDPSTWKQQVDFALDTAKQDGWRQWMGAANTGIPRWAGIRGMAQQQPAGPGVADGPKGQETYTAPNQYALPPNHPPNPTVGTGGFVASGADATPVPGAAAAPTPWWQTMASNIGKMGQSSIAAMGGGQPVRGGAAAPAAARLDQDAVPIIDPQGNEQQRQMLAQAMARLNSGRLF